MAMRAKLTSAATLLLAVAAGGGCALVQDANERGAGQSQDSALRPTERTIVGAGVAYPADTELRAQLDTLNGSVKARRAAAWRAVAKALTPVTLAEAGVTVDGVKPTVPLFRTWYGKDDFERTFAKMYSALTPEGRKAREAFSSDAITAAFATNATDRGSASDDGYLGRVSQVTDRMFLDGLGGNARVSYSPGSVRHWLSDYKKAFDCLRRVGAIAGDDAPPSDTNFAPCFTGEFPIDAAQVKASFWRADFGMTLPVYDTSAATLAAKRTGASDKGGWGKGIGQADPSADAIYTVKTSDEATFRMAGLHLATKELREWMWITLWWSPEPDTDFGADRPFEIVQLGGPWSNYKMCVVTGFDENDGDPRGGFDGTLGDALAATHEGRGGPTWCSNPYVEKGAKNAQTNCIGCHQHAGISGLTSERILANEALFPKSGRTKVRRNFPSDYLWAFDAPPEQLARVVERQVTHYDAVER